MSTEAPSPRRYALLLVGLGAAAGLIDAPLLASEAWRLGGGAWLVLLGAAVAGIGVPLVALEAGLARATGRPLPGALRARAGGWGELAGWWAMGVAAGLTLLAVVRAGWVIHAALPESVQGPGAILCVLALIFGANHAWSDRSLLRLSAGAAAAVAGLVAMGAGAAWTRTGGGSGLVVLLTPRPEALLHSEPWAALPGHAMVLCVSGIGLISAGGRRLPDRARVGGQGLGVAVGGAALALLSITAVMGAWFSAGALPPGPDATVALFSTTAQAVAAATPPVRALPALALLTGAIALTAVTGAAWSDAVVDKWAIRAGSARALVSGVGALFAGLGVWVGLPDPLGPSAGGAAAALIERWLLGVALPLAGLGLCLAARQIEDLRSLFQHLDWEGGPRLGSWAPAALRGPVPVALALGLALALGDAIRAFPGADLPTSRLGGLPDPLVGALHVAVPAGLLVLLCAAATGLSWLAGDPHDSPRRST